jgi:hypothetical protein
MNYNILISPSGTGSGSIKLANLSYDMSLSFLKCTFELMPEDQIEAALLEASNGNVTFHGLWLEVKIAGVNRETKTYHFG